MGRVGRFACVAVPFALTIASLVCLLIVCLSGVSNKGLYLFQVNTKDLSISASDAQDLVLRDLETRVDITSGVGNVTAATLSLADSYKIDIWTYCSTTGSTTTCQKAAFNWAKNATNTTAFTDLALEVAGVSISIPDTITSSLKTFSTVSYWTQIVYIIAGVATVLELVIGLFALCSRIGSCFTFIISGFSTVAVIAASILATVMASVTVGSIQGFAKKFGVTGSINTSFLTITWLAAAFSLGASLFWMFSICCCKGGSDRKDRSFRDSHRNSAQAPLVGAAAPFSGGYQRVHDPYQPQETGVTGYGVPMHQIRNQRQVSGAYEPYSHGAV